MSKRNYGIIEHTADIGISVTADDLKSLFECAALAMFDIIARKKERAPGRAEKHTIEINVSGQDREELLVNWLNELLSLSDTRGLIFCSLQIRRFTETGIRAEVSGFDSDEFELKKEIKAATYHGLRIEKKRKRFYAEVIFDV